MQVDSNHEIDNNFAYKSVALGQQSSDYLSPVHYKDEDRRETG